MPGSVDPSLLVLIFVGFFACAVVAWRGRIEGGVLWALGWMALVGAGLAMRRPDVEGVAAASALTATFAVLMLAGMFRHADRRVPRELVVGAVVFVVLRTVLVSTGQLELAVVLKLALEPLLFGVAMLVALRMGPAVRARVGGRLLPFTFLAMALMSVNDGVVVLTGQGISLWRYFALPVLAIQALVTGELGYVSMARSQRTLRATLARYRAIAESARDVILEVGIDGRIHYVSPSFSDVFGYAADDVLGRSVMALAHPDVTPMAHAELERFRVEGQVAPVVARVRHGDGTWRWVESSATVATQEGETRFILVCRDVSDRRRVEEAMRESQRRFDVLAERSGALIVEIGPDARVTYISPNVERFLGLNAADAVGATLYDLARRAGGADVTDIRPDDTLDDILARGVFRRTRRVVDVQGRVREIESEVVEDTAPDAPRRGLIVGRDVTERVLLEQQLRETQKLESLGVLAGGIAHDFNNLLAIMLGNASLARSTLPPGAREQRHLAEIETAAERAADLTHQLLSYAGRGSLETAPLEIGALIIGMVDLLDSAIPADVRLAFDCTADLPPIEADAGELQQIILNLVTNASEAIDGSGVVWLGTRRVDVGPGEAGEHFVGEVPAPGAYVALEVRDSGRGIDDATRARLFDPFFSSKGLGRGLGLAAVLGIVRSHRGALRLETAPGRGSRFEVLLPVSERALPSKADRDPSSDVPPAGTHGTVLVVDDEDGVRFAATLALEYGGFRVLAAANGAEAVALFGTHHDEIVAVVLDKSMPVMGGEEALRQMRCQRHDLPIVLTSGFTGSMPRPGSYEGPLPSVLPKPYRSEALVDAVHGAIRGEPSAVG